jgi:hypothetical protein
MFVAIMDSEYYQWVAFGEDADQATENLLKAFNAHLAHGGFPPYDEKLNGPFDEYYGVWIHLINTSVVYRDGVTITLKEKS